MRRYLVLITLLGCWSGAMFGQQPAAGVKANAKPAPLKVGFAERDITPEIGMEQPGGYSKAFHRTFHDACKVRASVWDDGNKRVAIVGLDALLIRRETVEKVRQQIHQRCGIATDAILISASHSHSSGPTGMVMPGEFDHASELVRKLAYEKSSTADPQYLEILEKQLIDAVCAADAARASAMVGVGKGIEDQVAFNRRFRMRSGFTATHPRQGNPDIIEPAGPTDPEVGVIGAWDEKGNLKGCIVNFACHATTSPGGISANYIYYLEQAVRGFFGKDTIVVFLPGCCGDITQVDNLSPYVAPKPEQWAKLVGGRVGAEAVKVLLTVEPGIASPIDYKTTLLDLGRRIPKPERVQKCLELVTNEPSGDPTEWLFAKEIVLLDALIQKHPRAQVEVQVVQIGPAVFVTNPAEYFVEYGLQIKRESPFPFTFPVELANGCVGYVPTEEALGPRGGGYETRLTYYSNLEPTAGTKIMRAGIELAKQLKPGETPTRTKVGPWQGGPWSYGNVPPEVD